MSQIEPKFELTAEHQQAIESISRGDAFVYIDGKAGVGKTALLNLLKGHFEKMGKSFAVVAPTGIAAIQAQGQTINSFFKFSPRIYSPSDIKKPKDVELYKTLQILFIDEISMVRADVLDSIDIFLRRARGINKPFGSVQIVVIGDLFQLPPVVPESDKPILIELGYTQGFYFFNANVFHQLRIKHIQLTKVFRQKDIEFTDVLNKIREAKDNFNTVKFLNSKCFSAFKKPHPLAVTLCTTNAVADQINKAALEALPETSKTYTGRISNDFKATGNNLPAAQSLVLKVGTVVMFTANEKDERRWVNGTVGIVTALHDSTVSVKLENGTNVIVGANEWISYEYALSGKKLSATETGKYTQLPLTYGWAITIHKSQGKTIEHLHVNLGYGAFASGQTYVALSRAVNLEGMTFQKPLRESDIICCPIVQNFFNPVFELT